MKTTREESFVMNTQRVGLGCVAALVVSTLAVGQLVGACSYSNCGKGFIQDPHSDNCIEAPAPAPEAGPVAEAGTTDDGGTAEGGASTEDFFGKKCASSADCGGNAPACGAPQFPVCTQINCSAGEANAGACPTTGGWTCFAAAGGNPSACFNPADL